MSLNIEKSDTAVGEAPDGLRSGTVRTMAGEKELTIALAGNPNAGKTTLFNALTGLRQKVANFPGVTVERKEGIWDVFDKKGIHRSFRLIDLPGLYSLDAASPDERIARDVLLGKISNLEKPNVLIAAVDATNLERNLYLVTQLLEFDIPVVVALTMNDLAERQNLQIDAEKLSEMLGTPVIRVWAARGEGLEELAAEVFRISQTESAGSDYPDRLPRTGGEPVGAKKIPPGQAVSNRQIFARYNFISNIYQEAVREDEVGRIGISEKIDRLLTHKFYGLLILTGILLLVFQAIFSWANLPMELLDLGFGTLGEMVGRTLPPGILNDLIVDGVIAGVGGVLIFLPQILLLFLFISILEDTGYLARAAFLLDRLMRGVGLHGKAFLPLLSSFACAIPGIMSARTIEDPKDRLATILIAPFMSCSARLPVYTLMIAAFFSGQYVFGFLSLGAVLILLMYLLGMLVAVLVASILKRTLLKAPPPPFLMELPPYRLPNLKTVLLNMFSRAGIFVKRAGTVILTISILLWALAYFPRTETPAGGPAGAEIAGTESAESEQLKNSFAGQLGRFIEPAIEPLGFDWKTGVALIASFAAREVLVSTLSIIYNAGADEDEKSPSLINAVREARTDDGRRAWTPLTALTIMVFFVLAMQCMSTVAVVRRETNSWRWPLFMIAYMTALAYLAALATYQIGSFLGFG